MTEYTAQQFRRDLDAAEETARYARFFIDRQARAAKAQVDVRLVRRIKHLTNRFEKAEATP